MNLVYGITSMQQIYQKKEELFDIISSKAKHFTRLQDNKNYFGF